MGGEQFMISLSQLAKQACAYARSIAIKSLTSPEFNSIKSMEDRRSIFNNRDQIHPFRLAQVNDIVIQTIYSACFAYKTSYGNCGEVSSLALLYIFEYLKKYNLQGRITAKMVALPSYDMHCFVVIQNKHILTADNSYICDPLMNERYKESELLTRARNYSFDENLYMNNYPRVQPSNGKYYLDIVSTDDIFNHPYVINRTGNVLNQIALVYIFKLIKLELNPLRIFHLVKNSITQNQQQNYCDFPYETEIKAVISHNDNQSYIPMLKWYKKFLEARQYPYQITSNELEHLVLKHRILDVLPNLIKTQNLLSPQNVQQNKVTILNKHNSF